MGPGMVNAAAFEPWGCWESLLPLGWIVKLWWVCLAEMMHGMSWVECWVDCSCQWKVLCCSGEEVHCLVEWVLLLLVLGKQREPVASCMKMVGPAYYLGKVSLRAKRCLHHPHPACLGGWGMQRQRECPSSLRGEEVMRQEILSLQPFSGHSYHHHCLTLRDYQWKKRSWKACLCCWEYQT